MKKLGVAEGAPGTSALWGRARGGIYGAWWLLSLLRCSERLSLKGINWRMVEEDTKCPTLACVWMLRHTHLHVCEPTRTGMHMQSAISFTHL